MAPPSRQDAVGWRVRVFWEGEAQWFEGVVARYDADSGYFVHYDDGEEQWEDEYGDTPIEFLSKPGVEQAPSSPDAYDDAYEEEDAYEYEEDNHDVKQRAQATDDEEDSYDDEVAPPKKNPTPEAQSAGTSPTIHAADKTSNRQPRKAALHVNSAVFFHDEETLREMKTSLQREKQTLAHEFHALSTQLVAKEQLSVTLKRELEELKTQVTLASVLGHASIGSPASSCLSAPKTLADWNERVLDQKLRNKQLQQDVIELQACVQQKQHTNQQQGKQRDQLYDTLNRVPRRDLCTLVDVQFEIAKLLEKKRALLETQAQSSTVKLASAARSSKQNASDGTFGSPDDSEATTKVALEKELRRLELASVRTKDEIRKWKLQSERENARILPLRARMIALRQELATYESSQVLLQSAFLRLHPDADGRVSKLAAADAFLALAPAHAGLRTRDDVLQRLQQQQEETMSLSDFVAGFQHLFTT